MICLMKCGVKYYPEAPRYSLSQELKTLERERIVNALALASGNQTKAAQSLDIGRTALIAKMKKI